MSQEVLYKIVEKVYKRVQQNYFSDSQQPYTTTPSTGETQAIKIRKLFLAPWFDIPMQSANLKLGQTIMTWNEMQTSL